MPALVDVGQSTGPPRRLPLAAPGLGIRGPGRGRLGPSLSVPPRLLAANVVVSVIVAVLLMVQRGRHVRLASVAVAAGTLVAFAASRLPGGLFGFQ
jgi:hypothetical protein